MRVAGLRKCGFVSLGLPICLLLSACPSNSPGGGTGGRPPLAPAGLTATAGNTQITLNWSASSGATNYNVTRATAVAGQFMQIAQPTGTATSYVDMGLTNGTDYFYYVTAVNSFGESANSKEANAIPNPPAQIPPVPTGLQATPADSQVNLTWNASAGATEYPLMRATVSGGPYTQLNTPTTASYSDMGLTNGTTYYYVVAAENSAGQSANSTEVSATPSTTNTIPLAPTGVVANAGNMQVVLTWNASAGATSYQVKRATVNGGPYTQTGASPTTTSFTDTGLTNGTTYFYVIVASNSAGLSPNSNQVSAIPSSISGTNIQVNVDALSNRHVISPYVYGTNFPTAPTDITNTGMTLVRWGGNASTRYNWELFDTNAANDYFFENRAFGLAPLYQDSTQFVPNVTNAGGNPLMTIGMLPWAAKDQNSYSFSVAKYGAQCSVDPSNVNAGNGVMTDCKTNITGNNPNDANTPLLDAPNPGDPPNSVYRSQWLPALASAFGGSQPHFYDMDNEMDIWGSTHRDVHPNPTGYNEMRDTFLTEAGVVEKYDPQAVLFAPVSCCWYFYWNGANGSDKGAHAGIDFLPWWLNEIFWSDTLSLTRTIDAFDVHAYPDAPDNISSMTHAQQQAATLRIYRDYWDPTYVSESGAINQQFVTQIQPLRTIPFRIPRMRGMLNMIYPGTPLSITEWSAAFAGESDFSTALADADAYGILGRERVTYAARWTSPVSANPNYLALKLYRNYDGAHSTFASTSVSTTHNADPNLFSAYSSLSQAGTTMTLMIVNKDPVNEARVTFALNNYTPTSYTTYSISAASPTAIASTASLTWNPQQTFPPYSATIVVVTGALAQGPPAAEWDLNPETIQAPSNSIISLSPTILSGVSGATVTLQTAQFDPGYTAGGSITIKTSQITQSGAGNGLITIVTGGTPGFYHFTVTSLDSSSVTQKQGGWVIVGNPAATITKTGDNQTGGVGTKLTLSATLVLGSSGGTNSGSGASILFSTSAGNFSGSQKTIAVTNGSGIATVTLTLPASATTAKVIAEGPYALGHPVVSYTETAQ